MMSLQQFKRAFDPARWISGAEVIARLDTLNYWEDQWREASIAAKAAYVSRQCQRWRDQEGMPLIVSLERGEGEERTTYYKPEIGMTPEDYREAQSYYYQAARDDFRAAEHLGERWAEHGGRSIMQRLLRPE
jgi:hypothetical protein